MDAGPKCINALMLIQMGLVVAMKSTAAKSLKFNINWKLKDRAEVESLYGEVVDMLKGYTLLAVYNTYFLIFGDRLARYMAEKHSFNCPLQVAGS